MSDYISHLKDLRMRKCRGKSSDSPFSLLAAGTAVTRQPRPRRQRGAGVGPEVHGLKPKLNKQTVSNYTSELLLVSQRKRFITATSELDYS